MDDRMGEERRPIVVVGNAAVDAKAKASEPVLRGGSVPGQIRVGVGGVARNVAECLARLEVPTVLFTVVGDDPLGSFLLETTARAGVDVSPTLQVPGGRTNAYFAMLEPGGALGWAVDDMGALRHLTPAALHAQRALVQGARAVVIDNNLPLPTIEALVGLCREARVPICADPTRAYLAPRLRPFLPSVNLITPNQQEAAALCDCAIEDVDDALRAAQQLVRMGTKMALITMGDMGVVYATAQERGHLAAPSVEVVDRTGGSDAMMATVVYALTSDFPVDEAVRLSITAATLTITSPDTVRPDLSLELLYDSLVV